MAWGASEKIYLSYAKYMTKLNNVKKAKFIYQKTCESYNYSQKSLVAFAEILKIYGSLDDILKIKSKLKYLN